MCSLMAMQDSAYTTKELSKKTWPDFEKLFSQKNGWDFCWCMHCSPALLAAQEQVAAYQSGARRAQPAGKEGTRRERTRARDPGLREGESPLVGVSTAPGRDSARMDNRRNYQALAPKSGAVKLWRITCFVVDKKHRKHGAATAALQAALEAIKQKGEGSWRPIPSFRGKSFAAAEYSDVGMRRLSGTSPPTETCLCSGSTGSKRWPPFGNNNVLIRRTV
jgi:hypothetical protein